MAKRKLTLKQKEFIEAFTNPDSPTFGNQSKSALRVGYGSPQRGYEVANNPNVREEIERTLESKGFGSDKILKRIVEIIEVNDSAKDRTNALQGCRMLLELMDKFPSKKIEEKVEEVGNINKKDIEDLKEILGKSIGQGQN